MTARISAINMGALQLGQWLLAEGEEHIFIGCLIVVDFVSKSIVLNQVVELRSDKIYDTRLKLELSQLKALRSIYDRAQYEKIIEDTIENESNGSSKNEASPGHIDVAEEAAQFPNRAISPTFTVLERVSYGSEDDVKICKSDIMNVQQQLRSVTYIRKTDAFINCVFNYLMDQNEIAVLLAPTWTCCPEKPSLIVFASWSKIYVCDMRSLNTANVGGALKSLLEAEKPRKIVYCGLMVFNALKTYYDIKLRNIFDTFTAYCILTNDKEPRNIVEIASRLLNIPKAYFAYVEESDQPQELVGDPVTVTQLRYWAKRAAYLLRVRDYIVDRVVLKNLDETCIKFSRSGFENILNHAKGEFGV